MLRKGRGSNQMQDISTLNVKQAPAADPFQTNAFQDLLDDIRSRRAEIEELRHVPQDLIARMKAVGIYRAVLPTHLGGMQVSLMTFLRMLERISAADGSVGWVASFGGTTYLAALPMHRLREIYAHDTDVAFAGALFPVHRAERVDGGLRINGRWNFASGCMGADLLGVGVTVDGDPVTAQGTPIPRLVVLKPEQVTIADNWQVVGLCGTGSHDLIVDNVVVPEDWSFIRGGDPLSLTEPAFRFPALARAAVFHATVGLGVAREALDELIALSGTKTSITGAPSPGDRAHVQRGLALAEAALGSARAYLYSRVEAVWDTLVAGGNVDPAATNLVRLAAINAATVSAHVTRTVCKLVGTSTIRLSSPLQRFMRDAHAVSVHAFLGEHHLESAGRILLGMKPLPGYP